MQGETVYMPAVMVGNSNWRDNAEFNFMGRKHKSYDKALEIVQRSNVELIYQKGCYKSYGIVYEIKNYLTSEQKVTRHEIKTA